jgi:UPF0271 protein
VRIDLNADVGEGSDDEPLFPYLSSVSVACGGHAGDPQTMARTIEAAGRFGLAVGAHPSYADREHFGRRELVLSWQEVQKIVEEQIRVLDRIARKQGVLLVHVKPHGALYNQAARDPSLAQAIARAVRQVDPALALVGLAGSALLIAGRSEGLAVFAEAFADRRYREDGTLAPRSAPGAVIEDPEAAAAQATAIARGSEILTVEGKRIQVRADTLCLHSDTPGALGIVSSVRRRLEADGVDIAPLRRAR